jgi:hypothetical protein
VLAVSRKSRRRAPEEPPQGAGCAALLLAGCIAAVGYGVLAFRSPHDWSLGLWRLLAFGAVPALAGYAVHAVCPRRAGGTGAFTAAFAVGIAMAVYAGASLSVANSRLSIRHEDTFRAIWWLVTGAYAGLAAAVAAGTCWWAGRRAAAAADRAA